MSMLLPTALCLQQTLQAYCIIYSFAYRPSGGS